MEDGLKCQLRIQHRTADLSGHFVGFFGVTANRRLVGHLLCSDASHAEMQLCMGEFRAHTAAEEGRLQKIGILRDDHHSIPQVLNTEPDLATTRRRRETTIAKL